MTYFDQIDSIKSETKRLRIASINVRTLQGDITLATIIKVTESLGIDALALQEVRCTGSDCFEFDDESLKGWQFAWSGYDVKKFHGVAILLAPSVELEGYKEHLKGRILSAIVVIKGLKKCAGNYRN